MDTSSSLANSELSLQYQKGFKEFAMHTLHIEINDAFFDKFMHLLKTLPQGEVRIIEDDAISFEEARKKVKKSLNELPKHHGVPLERAFEIAFDK